VVILAALAQIYNFLKMLKFPPPHPPTHPKKKFREKKFVKENEESHLKYSKNQIKNQMKYL